MNGSRSRRGIAGDVRRGHAAGGPSIELSPCRRRSPASSCSSTTGPRASPELFLVDGNNLAYRAFFALPEELATSEGCRRTRCSASRTCCSSCSPTTGRAASRSRGTRARCTGRRSLPSTSRSAGRCPTCCASSSRTSGRSSRRSATATSSSRAGRRTTSSRRSRRGRTRLGIKTCVVSTDRDAFQLVSENVCLMMTPRGVADVNVYTPERVELATACAPTRCRTSSASRATTSDNIPGVPGIGDKTAGQLIAQYGSLEGVLEHVDELSPARRKNITEHAEQALRLEGARDHAARPRHRLRPGRPRARAARSLAAEGDLPAVRVPRPALAGRHARRGRSRPLRRPN